MKNDIYDDEARAKYGDAVCNAVDEIIMKNEKAFPGRREALENEIKEALISAAETKNPASEEAHRLCELHKEWLLMSWTPEMYSPEAHIALAEGYLADSRFVAYYDSVTEGGAVFLRDALKCWLS